MDKTEFELAFKRNSKRLNLIALSFTGNRYDAEDILQNVFLKLWKAKKDFECEEHIDKWLTAVTVNESKNLLGSAFRRRRADPEDFTASYFFDCEKSEDLAKAVMVIMKKGVTKEQLRQRLSAIFRNSGVGVWQCDFVESF